MSYSLAHRPVGFLGQADGRTEAGEINGVQLLLVDVNQMAIRAREFMPEGFRFSKSSYETMMREFTRREGEDEDEAIERIQKRYSSMSGEDVQTLIAGTVGAVADAVVRATAISKLRVADAQERARNHAVQASIIDPARLMWAQLSQMLRNMEARRTQATSGLGVLPVVVMVALVIGGTILTVAVIAAGTYLADGWHRLSQATREAQRLCEDNGGCSPEQYAAIRSQLAKGPLDAAMEAFGEGAGAGAGVAIAVAGIGGAALLAGALWYYALGGREWIAKKRSARSSE